MSATFTDFLREQVSKRTSEAAERKAILEEWTAALNRLYATVREWVTAGDPDGILTVTDEVWEANEEGLGKYKVPCLEIRGLGRWVGLVPKARHAVATAHPPQKTTPDRAAGRVDITNDVRRIILYRFRGDEGDLWLMDDQKNPARMLDRAAFETALMGYLR